METMQQYFIPPPFTADRKTGPGRYRFKKAYRYVPIYASLASSGIQGPPREWFVKFKKGDVVHVDRVREGNIFTVIIGDPTKPLVASDFAFIHGDLLDKVNDQTPVTPVAKEYSGNTPTTTGNRKSKTMFLIGFSLIVGILLINK